MSASIKFIKDGANTVYPVTIAAAIIDPSTGNPISLSGGGGTEVEYTINGIHADSTGNFTVTAASLNAAVSGHTHSISDINSLQNTLNGKSDSDHTHVMVTGMSVGASLLTGDVQLRGAGNVSVTNSGNSVVISISPYTADVGSVINDANSNNSIALGLFTGTETEWNAFKSTISNNKRYLVFIRS